MKYEIQTILLVESSAAQAGKIHAVLQEGFPSVELTVAQSLAGARKHLSQAAPDLLITNLALSDGTGLELLPGKPQPAAFPILTIADHNDMATAVTALQAGALDCITISAKTLATLPESVGKACCQWADQLHNRKKAKAIQENEEIFRSFFESAASGMAIISHDGKALKVNPTFCRLSGYSASEAQQKTILEVTHPDDREQTRRLYDEISTGRRRVIDIEKRYLHKDGSIVWGHATIAGIFDPQGQLNYFAASVQPTSARKQAEEAQRRSEEKFRTIFDNAAAGMTTISPDGHFLESNAAFVRFMGYSRDELLTLRVSDITHPDDRTITAKNYRLLASGERAAIDYQKRFQRKDGDIVWGLVSVTSVPDSDGRPLFYNGLVQDITESKRVHDQIRESKQMLQQVIDAIPQHVFWKNRDSVYLGCNRNFARTAGIEIPQNLVGKVDYELPWRKNEADFYRQCDRRVMETDTPELHIIETQLQSSGKQAWLDTNKIPLHNSDGEVIGILGTFEDITERKKAEDELIALNRELDAFVYTVSHDLRTPLTPIISYAEVLQETCRDQIDQQSLDCLAKIESQGRRMQAIMEDLLILAQVGHLQHPTTPADLNSLLDEVLVTMGSQIAQSGIIVSTSSLPTLQMPTTLLSQIFSNLIGNAVQYAGKAGSPIEVGGERSGERVRLFVRDHGPGLPPAERKKVFELFFRGTTGKKSCGTGVGLATVQKICKLYGGRSWQEETPGGGSTFWVELIDGHNRATPESVRPWPAQPKRQLI